MVDKYYRKIDNVGNDIENSIQISGILLKLKEYDEKLSDLSKIGNNENNISSNLGKINANKYNIATNSSSISIDKNNIATNTNLIYTNKSSYNRNEIYIYMI